MPTFRAKNFSLMRQQNLHDSPSAARVRGFTLMELCVVIVIITMVAAVGLPQLTQVLIFSEVQAEAQRLANYGAGAISEAALFGANLTVYIDLDNQEYYATRLAYPEAIAEGEDSVNHMGMLQDFRRSGDYTPAQISDMLAGQATGNRQLTSSLPREFDAEQADRQMADRFDRRHRQLLHARAQNVKHDAGFLSEIGPLFDTPFTLSWSEPVEEEIHDPILRRYRLPEGIRIAAVHLDGATVSSGAAIIQISPHGILQNPIVHLRNEDGDYFTVSWNGVTGRGIAREGRWDA